MKELIIVSTNEDEIFQVFDDALFFGEINKYELETLSSYNPECEVDSLINSALTRALSVTIPNSLNDIIPTRRS